MPKRGDWLGKNEWAPGDDALVPRRKPLGLVISRDVLPVSFDEVAVPLIEAHDPSLMEHLHAEAGRLEFVLAQHQHESLSVFGVLQLLQTVLKRGSDPLDRVPEQ